MQDYKSKLEDTRKTRRKGAGGTQEFFTPSDLVKKMCDKIPEEAWADKNETFLEPCAGNGNFVIEIIERRLNHGVSLIDTLSTLYVTELMQDNVDEMKERIMTYLSNRYTDLDEQTVKEIMERNIICTDFFKWNYEEWRPYTEEELKNIKRKK